MVGACAGCRGHPVWKALVWTGPLIPPACPSPTGRGCTAKSPPLCPSAAPRPPAGQGRFAGSGDGRSRRTGNGGRESLCSKLRRSRPPEDAARFQCAADTAHSGQCTRSSTNPVLVVPAVATPSSRRAAYRSDHGQSFRATGCAAFRVAVQIKARGFDGVLVLPANPTMVLVICPAHIHDSFCRI